MGHFVYILYSEKLDKYYIGCSHDPAIRLEYYNRGGKVIQISLHFTLTHGARVFLIIENDIVLYHWI